MARDGSLKLRVFPWRRGLATAGQQATIPEDSLWKAQDMTAGLDGLLQKRPGLRQWGQTIVEGTITEPFIDSELPGWIENNDDSSKLSTAVSQGQLRASAASGSSNETLTLSRPGSVETDASIRFIMQAVNLPDYTPSGTSADTFHFRVADSASTGWEFAMWSEGLYYKQSSDNTYALISGTADVGEGAWSVVDIRIDADGDAEVRINDTLVDTLSTSDIATTSLVSGDAVVELAWEVDPSQQHGANLVTVMWSPTADDPWTSQTIQAVTDFRASIGAGSLQRTIMCAAGGYVYHDAGLLGVWRPLRRKTYDKVTFAPYRKSIVWVEHNAFTASRLWEWSGASTDEPEELDEAPTCQFATEHQTRIWVAGDRRHPLRIYYCGDRETNIWFAPDENNISDRFDTQLKSGYLEVPSRKGDEVTAIFGDYYGTLLVFTRQGVYRIQGSGPQTYAIQSVTQDVGCESFEAAAQVGNDVWFLSREGVHAVSATDKFGDLMSGFVSGPIQDLWGGDASSVSPVNKTYIGQSRLRYNSTLGLVYVAVPLTTDTTASNIFVYNATTQEWYGPWKVESTAIDKVEIASPVTEVVMHGDTKGRLRYTDQLHKSDTGEAIESIAESAILDGRTLDPSLIGLEKTFKRLRVFVLPRGDWDAKVFWKVDNGFYQEESASNKDQNKTTNIFNTHPLTDEFRLGEDPDGRLHSREEMGYFEISLDKRGYGLSFKIEQDGAGEDIAIQGFEVDFIPHGYARE